MNLSIFRLISWAMELMCQGMELSLTLQKVPGVCYVVEVSGKKEVVDFLFLKVEGDGDVTLGVGLNIHYGMDHQPNVIQTL